MASRTKKDTPELTEQLDKVHEQLAQTTSDFMNFRRRAATEQEKALAKGKDSAVMGLLGLVDDCDRALETIGAGGGDGHVAKGLQQLLQNTLRHFKALGYESVGEPGEAFDPHIHEALKMESGPGIGQTILKVNGRGWKRDGILVKAATVVVLQGTTVEEEEQPVAVEEPNHVAPSKPRRRRVAVETDYVCPYGIPGCQQDCPGCAPLPEDSDPFAEAIVDDPFAGLDTEGENF